MKLVEALNILQQPTPPTSADLRVFLACGFMPLHLETFLGAFLRVHSPGFAVKVTTGLYGDCLGSVERLETMVLEAATVVVEWSDLDPRIGLRHLGGWRPTDLPDILTTVLDRAGRFAAAIERAAAKMPVAVCLPTLAIPPLDFVPGWRAGAFTSDLRASVSSLAARLCRHPRVRVVNPQRLDQVSPLPERLDVRMELFAGFPYRTTHAAAVAELLALLLRPPQAKKGLITDLDDTLWSGIVGDVGAEGVSWDIDSRTHVHGIYQQMLAALADSGVLIAAASKNDLSTVQSALGRSDLVFPQNRLFPLEVHWQAKSSSVERILRAWNVSADSVVFVDDSPMELAEVQAAFPEMECVQFVAKNEAEVYHLLERLRDRFGKNSISEEDRLRGESVRRGQEFRTVAETGSTSEALLKDAKAELTFSFGKEPPDPRALELVNKTNQFNLNGQRYAEGSWMDYLRRTETVVLVVSYRDKFGPLGKIAVICGRVRNSTFVVDTWVMSCRAFSRRIEHQCLAALFEQFEVDEIEFLFEPTPRNGPTQDFLASILGASPAHGVRLSRVGFRDRCPTLYHTVKVTPHG